MTKTTTKTSWLGVIFSWGIALAGVIGLVLLLRLAPTPENLAVKPPEKTTQPVRKPEDKDKKEKPKVEKDEAQLRKEKKAQELRKQQAEKRKEEQSLRPLPSEYAQQLVKQAEEQAKTELAAQLAKFEDLSVKMRLRKDNLLTQVEKRRLSPAAPSDANNTSSARKIPQAGNPPLGPYPSVDEMYEMLRQYETEIQKNHLAVSAAKQTLSNGLSFPDVYDAMQESSSKMAGFEELIQNQTNGQEWKRSASSKASAGLQISNTADLNNYRGVLGQAARQAGLAGTRLESLFGIGRPAGNKPPGAMASQQGTGQGDGGMAINFKNTSNKGPMAAYEPRLNEDMVKAQALPGRRFSKTAERKGWLYINTWYMIGPWENYGRGDFAIVHPPEVAIDLDAVYKDGQIGEGTAETDSHPLKVIGPKVKLDGTLRWKFMQSESMHNTVPVTTGNATYYGYTELYFDEATTMLVAIGTDDSGRVWINGKDVWQDSGTSWYHIDEHITPFRFQQGWNTVLVRLENGGGGPTGFSFLICPQGAVSRALLDR